ncbi:RHS repeat-associated core domain-containing protein [Pseudomonas soli]|uniref:RHS repeat-associated core domain-containing protein n=1 Tax=Pseudomonas soli TaxID=1306993 RepID=UPI0028AF56F2|nr:RHS repeat-associated core domain-containing protein [Pseudomonas soli]
MSQGFKKSSETVCFATDKQGSVLHRHKPQEQYSCSYAVFGFGPFDGMTRLLGFTGIHREKNDIYLLGNGYRGYKTALMRFNSPDSWSPFERGGLNSYAYCQGDPVNMTDRSGHALDPKLPYKTNAAWHIDKLSGWPALLLNKSVVDGIKKHLPSTEANELGILAKKTQLAATKASNKAAFENITSDNYSDISDAIYEGTFYMKNVSIGAAEHRIYELALQHIKSLWSDAELNPSEREGRRRAIGRPTVEHREDSLDRLADHNERVQRIRDRRDNP